MMGTMTVQMAPVSWRCLLQQLPSPSRGSAQDELQATTTHLPAFTCRSKDAAGACAIAGYVGCGWMMAATWDAGCSITSMQDVLTLTISGKITSSSSHFTTCIRLLISMASQVFIQPGNKLAASGLSISYFQLRYIWLSWNPGNLTMIAEKAEVVTVMACNNEGIGTV